MRATMTDWAEHKERIEEDLESVRESLRRWREGKISICHHDLETGEVVDATVSHIKDLERRENTYVRILGKLKEVGDLS
jgi:5-methylcytosine-specific restriction endonuclease McrA